MGLSLRSSATLFPKLEPAEPFFGGVILLSAAVSRFGAASSSVLPEGGEGWKYSTLIDNK